MSKIYYIAGPMTGQLNLNRNKFKSAAERLEDEGHIALNPAILPSGLTQAQYMDICLAMVRCSTHVYMLRGWEDSAGATIEHDLAVKSEHITVEYQSDEHE